MRPRRRVRIPLSRATPKPGPEVRIYARDGEQLHPVYGVDGSPQLCGDESYVVSRFDPQHNLNPAKVRLADQLWRRANRPRRGG